MMVFCSLGFPWSSIPWGSVGFPWSSRVTMRTLLPCFPPTIFESDIKLSVYHLWCFISVCPFVALSKINLTNTSTLFCLVHIIKRSCLTACVFRSVSLNASSHLCFRFLITVGYWTCNGTVPWTVSHKSCHKVYYNKWLKLTRDIGWCWPHSYINKIKLTFNHE